MAHLLEQLSAGHNGEGFVPIVVIIDRIDVCQDIVGDSLPELARLIASGGRRHLFILASADVRLPLEPELAKAFRYRYWLRDDQSHIMEDAEGGLVRSYHPPSAEVPFPRRGKTRPLGRLEMDDVHRLVMEAPDRGLTVGVDDVRHEAVQLMPFPGIAVVGPAGSGRTSLLYSLCEQAAARTGSPVPILAGYAVPECNWLVDVRSMWASEGAKTPEAMLQTLRNVMSPAYPLLAIDDLDRLDLSITAMELVADPSLSFRMELGNRISADRISVLATGPIEVLLGKQVLENRLTDALHATHQNFVVLCPLPEEVGADRIGSYSLHRRIAARPGHVYRPGSGIAVSRGRRSELVVALSDDVHEAVDAMPAEKPAW